MIVSVVARGLSDDCNSLPIHGNTVYLAGQVADEADERRDRADVGASLGERPDLQPDVERLALDADHVSLP